MATNNILKKPRKIPYYLGLSLFTTGASLILGFLSFSGMYALMPVLGLAFASFGLSVAYEGEIYLQNIKGALAKLFKSNSLDNHMARDYLRAHFPKDTSAPDCPEFFKDYEKQLKLLELFGHKKLTPASQKKKDQLEKTLADMEKWFALQLFTNKKKPASPGSAYAQELQKWLEANGQQSWNERIDKRRKLFNGAKVFSALSALFMSLGTTYLIVEAFSVIPFFATIPFAIWPFIIVPMAVIAGAAYGLLTYNSITDMINNNTIKKWYYKLKEDLSKGLTLRNAFMTLAAVALAGLAIALTICTAGTWWTIATSSRPLFDWMAKIPSFIMGAINPVITGISAIFFNVENTSESLEMVDDALKSKGNIFKRIYQSIASDIKHLVQTENGLQILNPFRLLIKVTVTPLRVLLFLGHLLSIAVTADRMPGMSQALSALIAIISEGFEDAHYFVGHSHSHHHHKHSRKTKELLEERLGDEAGHSHDADIPTWILQQIASPLYAIAALWDSLASRLNKKIVTEEKHPKVLSFRQAWDKQRGNAHEHEILTDVNADKPSIHWQKEHVVAQIEKQERKHLSKASVGKTTAQVKIVGLNKLKATIQDASPDKLATLLLEEQKNPVYNKHRLFALREKTCTQEFLEELPNRVGLASS